MLKGNYITVILCEVTLHSLTLYAQLSSLSPVTDSLQHELGHLVDTSLVLLASNPM